MRGESLVKVFSIIDLGLYAGGRAFIKVFHLTDLACYMRGEKDICQGVQKLFFVWYMWGGGDL